MIQPLVILRACLCLALSVVFFSASASSEWLAIGPQIPDVEVRDQDGKRYKLVSELMRGRTVAINFIFTGCTTICPPQTAMFQGLQDALAKRQVKDTLLLSITVDPRGDGPEQLRAFAKRFKAQTGIAQRWLFLTGQAGDIERVLAGFENFSAAPEGHQAIVWVGNTQHKRWTRTASLNAPAVIADLMQGAQQ